MGINKLLPCNGIDWERIEKSQKLSAPCFIAKVTTIFHRRIITPAYLISVQCTYRAKKAIKL